jgi:hypothetical protein
MISQVMNLSSDRANWLLPSISKSAENTAARATAIVFITPLPGVADRDLTLPVGVQSRLQDTEMLFNKHANN